MPKEANPPGRSNSAEKSILFVVGTGRLDLYQAQRLKKYLKSIGDVTISTATRDYLADEALSPENESIPDIVISNGTAISCDEAGYTKAIRYDSKEKTKAAGSTFIKAGFFNSLTKHRLKRAVQKPNKMP